ncbi:HDOD domain-containing protein [bacterium]|nr:HDOD domain-containing protein [bacterium]MBU1989629.1 HDOD domain-containing protein [bacterium]
MTYESLVGRIESLPPLSDTAIIVEQLYSEGLENVDIQKLVKIIEEDALLTANILKMINAPIYGFSKRIASVSQAVTLFGTQMIYGLVINYSIHEKLRANIRPYGISNSEFNDICHLQSALMRQWYTKIEAKHANFLASLALIMEGGRLILAKEITASSYIKEFKEGLLKCENIEQYEDDLFETTSYYLSALLFEHWNLEPLYVYMLEGLDYELENTSPKMEKYINILDVIRIAVNVKEVLTKKSISRACAAVEDIGLNPYEFEKIAQKIKRTYDKTKQ